MSELEIKLREALVERLHLDDVAPEDITRETSLFDGGLELDSLDALEITVLVEEDYGIVVSVVERNESIFGTFGALVDFVQKNMHRDL